MNGRQYISIKAEQADTDKEYRNSPAGPDWS